MRNHWWSIVGLAVMLGIIAACAPAAPPVETPMPTEVVEVPTPTEVVEVPTPTEVVEEEKTLIYATSALGTSFDPSRMPGETTAEVVQAVYGSFTKYGAIPCPGRPDIMCDDTAAGDSGMKPGLFQSWEISEDGTVYTFHLPEGLLDSYGNPFTAEDAKWVFARMRETHGASEYVMNVLNITDWEEQIKVIDDTTLEITIPAPNPVFLRTLQVNNGSPSGARTLQEYATDDDPWATEWMGRNTPAVGPYMLESWTPGVEQVLVKNPNYYGPEPDIDRIIYREVPESSSRLALLLAGEVHITRDLSMEELEMAEETPGVKVICYPASRILWGNLNANMPPTDDARVRRALVLSVPYDDILEVVYRGYAKPMYAYGTEGYPDNLGADIHEQYIHTDHEEAKRLLAEAGYPDGFDLTMHVTEGRPTHERTAVLLKESFAKSGVNLTIEMVPRAVIVDLWLNHTAQFLFNEDYALVMDPNYAALLWFDPGPAPNCNGSDWRNSEMEEIMFELVTLPEGPERTKLVHREQEIFYEELPFIPFANPPTCYAMSEKVSGYTVHNHNQVGFDDLILED